MNLRTTVNKDLEKTMESEADWGLPIELIAPDGVVYDLKKDTQIRLSGQVLYNAIEFNPETGEEIIIDDPIVVLRLNSLVRIPLENERWIVKIPIEPDPAAALVSYLLSPNKAMKFNRSFGFVRMYLIKLEQI